MGVDTLRWTGTTLQLLDQRALPQKIEYVTCRTATDTARAIREMVVRGAPAIGCAAAFGIALEATRPAALEAAFDTLAHSRPTAVNLAWALARMRQALALGGATTLENEALAIYREDLAVNRAIGAHGAELVADGARIMTHCNAGALATAGHGTALGVVRSARDQGKSISVVASETRPYLQGARLTAWEMVQERIPVTLVTDSMAGYLMSCGEIDMLIVGADRIAANGDVANKIGTYTLAVLAQRHGLPFYVAAPRSTFDPAIAQGASIPIEERPPDEVTGYRGSRWAPEGVAVRNPAFDVTPAELVTGLITEVGVLRAPSRAGVAALLSRTSGAP